MVGGSCAQFEPLGTPQPHFQDQERLWSASAGTKPLLLSLAGSILGSSISKHCLVQGVCRSLLCRLSEGMSGGGGEADAVIILNCQSVSMLHHPGHVWRIQEIMSGVSILLFVLLHHFRDKDGEEDLHI